MDFTSESLVRNVSKTNTDQDTIFRQINSVATINEDIFSQDEVKYSQQQNFIDNQQSDDSPRLNEHTDEHQINDASYSTSKQQKTENADKALQEDIYDPEDDDDSYVDDQGKNNPELTNIQERLHNDYHQQQQQRQQQSEIWQLPVDKDDCSLEEIRRGQDINKTASNECPVIGCGKKINETCPEAPPGTIASGLRTHVSFVHYRKQTKKRKLCWSTSKNCWSNRRKGHPSPKKNTGLSNIAPPNVKQESGYERMNDDYSQIFTDVQNQSPNLVSQIPVKNQATSLLSKKPIFPKSKAPSKASATSILQQTSNFSNSHFQPSHSSSEVFKNSMTTTTSSLLSILAGLTQQSSLNNGTQQINQASNSPRISSICNQGVNSSLHSLLNEKISGNVANSLQSRLQATLAFNHQSKEVSSAPVSRHLDKSNTFDFNTASINTCERQADFPCDMSQDKLSKKDIHTSLSTLIASIAQKTNSNIGSEGIVEAVKVIEKFATALLCSSQTIADHYIAPNSLFSSDTQPKPEIRQSDILLAYKMMQKTFVQP